MPMAVDWEKFYPIETNPMIHVLATIEVTPGQRAAFLEQFHWVVPLVRAEEGCIEYGAAIDVPTLMLKLVYPWLYLIQFGRNICRIDFNDIAV